MQVYLSFDQSDATLARRITDHLAREGLTVWNPALEVFPGDNYALKIGKALENSNAMVVLVSEKSVKSDHILREIGFAIGNIDYKDRLVPVYLGDDSEALNEKAPWILKTMRSVCLRDPDDPADLQEALEKLTEILTLAAPQV